MQEKKHSVSFVHSDHEDIRFFFLQCRKKIVVSILFIMTHEDVRFSSSTRKAVAALGSLRCICSCWHNQVCIVTHEFNFSASFQEHYGLYEYLEVDVGVGCVWDLGLLVGMVRLLLLPGLSILSRHHVVEVDGSLSWSPVDACGLCQIPPRVSCPFIGVFCTLHTNNLKPW